MNHRPLSQLIAPSLSEKRTWPSRSSACRSGPLMATSSSTSSTYDLWGHRPKDGRQCVPVFTLPDSAVLHGLAVAQHLPIHTRQSSSFGIILGHDHPVHQILRSSSSGSGHDFAGALAGESAWQMASKGSNRINDLIPLFVAKNDQWKAISMNDALTQ